MYSQTSNWHRYIIIGLLLMVPVVMYGGIGETNYGFSGSPTVYSLDDAHRFVVNTMNYIVEILLAIAGIIGLVAALQIYFKMQSGEGEVSKNILTLFGACIFLIASFYVFPALFGYKYMGGSIVEITATP